MKIYVGSKFENSGEVKIAIAMLAADGHQVTHDWTDEDATGKTGDELDRYLRFCAERDVDGVARGEGMLLLDHIPAPKGGYSEFGMAVMKHVLGMRMCIVVKGARYEGPYPQNIFFTLPFIHHVDTLEDARRVFREFEQKFQPKTSPR